MNRTTSRASLLDLSRTAKHQGAYRCLDCGQEWQAKPGPVTCPEGQHHVHVRWLNYEETYGDLSL